MDLMYFKRYRMEITLAGRDLTPRQAPDGYRFEAWNPGLLEAFAEAKYLSFRSEIDANVFPCLGELDGCRRLMREIVRKPGFLAGTTWLLTYRAPAGTMYPWSAGCSRAPCTHGRGRLPEFCGTVQGIRDVSGLGAIQNLGITPEHRNGGLGTILLFHALQGFRQAGIGRVYPGSDRTERRCRAALSAAWLCNRENRVQGRRARILVRNAKYKTNPNTELQRPKTVLIIPNLHF